MSLRYLPKPALPGVLPDNYWYSLASSADGTHLVADARGEALYTSNDSGANWTVRNVTPLNTQLASSSDGTRLLAGPNGTTLFTSDDAGVTWTARTTSDSWTGVASSSDGSKLVAVSASGTLKTSTPMPASMTTIGTAGWLAGERYSAIDLQYAGGNVFLVRDSSGVLLVE